MNVKSAQIDGEGQLYVVMWCDLLWVTPNVGLAIVVAQYALMSPTEYTLTSPFVLMAATDTVYSASGTNPCNTILVVVVYTVVKLLEALVSVSRYLTL